MQLSEKVKAVGRSGGVERGWLDNTECVKSVE